MIDSFPSVSVVIPCLNEEKYIERCLQSIVDVDYPKEKLEVFVCDGISSDGSREIISRMSASYPYIHLLDNEARTTPHALNLGLKRSNAEVKIILGAHAEIDRQFILQNIETLKESEEVGCSGGIIENVYEDNTSELIGKAMSSSFGVGNAHFRTAAKEGFVDTVAFGAYRKEVFEKVGYFDEDLVRNQDDEFNFRLLKNGYKIFLSKAIRSKYYVRASLKKLYRQYYQYGYWKVFVNKKHKAITTFRQLVPLFFVLYLFIGIAASIIYRLLIGLFSFGLAIYFALSIFSAIRLHSSPIKILKTVSIFFILHFSYGLGYLNGIWRFVLLGKGPDIRQMKSSR